MLEILLTTLIFGIIILVHESGHFVAARLVGIKVVTFSLGLGPRIVQKKIGETVFCLSLVPFGGYVRPFFAREGENARAGKAASEAKDDLQTRSFEPRLLRWLAPISNDEQALTDKFLSQKKGNLNDASFCAKLLFLLNGLIFNIVFAYASFVGAFLIYAQIQEVLTIPKLGEIQEGSPAFFAGLQKDDLIISVDSQKVLTWQDVGGLFRDGNGRTFALEVGREESGVLVSKTFQFTPTLSEGSGKKSARLFYGFKAATMLRPVHLSEALTLAAAGLKDQAIEFSKRFFFGIETHHEWESHDTDRDTARNTEKGWGVISNMISIGVFASESFKSFTAMFVGLSLVVVILNAIPYPAFDGWQVLVLVVEKLLGSELSHVLKERLAFFGLASSMLVLVAGLGSDLYRTIIAVFS